MSMLTEPLLVLTETRLESEYAPLTDPDVVCRYVSRESKATESNVPAPSEMDVLFVTEKVAPPWTCIPRCEEMTSNVSSVAPGAMYSTIDMPRHADPADIPLKLSGMEGSPMVRPVDVAMYLMLLMSTDGDTAYETRDWIVPAA
jgi:hypothetical protein